MHTKKKLDKALESHSNKPPWYKQTLFQSSIECYAQWSHFIKGYSLSFRSTVQQCYMSGRWLYEAMAYKSSLVVQLICCVDLMWFWAAITLICPYRSTCLAAWCWSAAHRDAHQHPRFSFTSAGVPSATRPIKSDNRDRCVWKVCKFYRREIWQVSF